MTGPAAVLMAVGLALLGAVLDGLTGTGLRGGFAVAFATGCVLAALLVRHRDLLVVAVMPPLAYLLVVVVTGAARAGQGSGSWLVRNVMDVLTALVLDAPVLLLTSAAVGVVALVRGRRRRLTSVGG